jgi:hypothetical protein
VPGFHSDRLVEGEPYISYPIESASGPGATVYLHDAECPRVPIQTAPLGEHR